MLPIVGLQKTSLIDYPGYLASIIFTAGCNMCCPYCHNPELVSGSNYRDRLDEILVLEHLKKRSHLLDGVVITGGEPTIHGRELLNFTQQVKKLNYLIKLDTNGTNPELLEKLITENQVDYIAMDLKSSDNELNKFIQNKKEQANIRQSLKILKRLNNLSHPVIEFRTTLHPHLHNEKKFIDMLELIEGTSLYVLQTFRNKKTLDPAYQDTYSFSEIEMKKFKTMAESYVKTCILR